MEGGGGYNQRRDHETLPSITEKLHVLKISFDREKFPSFSRINNVMPMNLKS